MRGRGEVQAAVARAHAAQAAWAEIGVRRRIAVLREFQRRLHEKKSEIAEAITREAGKPVAEALTTEVLVVLDAARFLIDNAYRLLRDEPVPHGNLATKLKSGRLGARALWRGGDHFAVELSIFDSRDRDACGSGGGECRGAEALGIYFSGRAGTASRCCTRLVCLRTFFRWWWAMEQPARR